MILFVEHCTEMKKWITLQTGPWDISMGIRRDRYSCAQISNCTYYMVIGNIIGTINTPQGRANLDRIYDERIAELGKSSSIPSENGQDLRQIDDFLTKIAKIQIDSEIIKSDSRHNSSKLLVLL